MFFLILSFHLQLLIFYLYHYFVVFIITLLAFNFLHTGLSPFCICLLNYSNSPSVLFHFSPLYLISPLSTSLSISLPSFFVLHLSLFSIHYLSPLPLLRSLLSFSLSPFPTLFSFGVSFPPFPSFDLFSFSSLSFIVCLLPFFNFPSSLFLVYYTIFLSSLFPPLHFPIFPPPTPSYLFSYPLSSPMFLSPSHSDIYRSLPHLHPPIFSPLAPLPLLPLSPSFPLPPFSLR